MTAAHELLGVPASELGAQLRYGLSGLRAALAAALVDHPDDPGAAACRRYLAQLDEQVALALDGARQPGSPADDGAVAVDVGPGVDPRAEAELLDLPITPPWLRDPAWTSKGASSWRRFHIAALRLSEPDANRWVSAVAEALGPADPVSETTWRTLPGGADGVLVPPYSGNAGWRTEVDAPADRDVVDRLRVHSASDDPHRAELARMATTVLAMTELDVDLLFGLESVRYLGLGRLDDTTRAAFRRDLLDRLGSYGDQRYGTVESFMALLLVDEALHSVLHLPPSAPGSWWSRLQDGSRALVFAAQRDHPGVDVPLLARHYRETKALTSGNDIRHPLDRSGAVLACLRLWARVDGKDLPGRVVYSG